MSLVIVSETKYFNVAYVRNVTVILGRKCNGCCVYCAQSGLSVIEDKPFNDDFVDYLVELVNIERKDKNDKLQILLYGGEPLLYWESIKKIVCGVFGKVTNLDSYYFKIFTNGALLNDEMVDFFNKFNVRVVLSFDGPNEMTRPVRLRDDQIGLFRRIKLKSLSFVVTRLNNNILMTFVYLKKKFGDDIRFDNLALCFYYNGDVTISSYSITSYKEFYQIFSSFVNYYKVHPIDNLFWHLFRGVFRCNSIFKQDKLDFISVDVSGNLYGFSDVEDSILGNIYSDCVDSILNYRKITHISECINCEYNSCCRTYYGPRDFDGKIYNCQATKLLLKALFNLKSEVVSILSRPENRNFINKLDSNWNIKF